MRLDLIDFFSSNVKKIAFKATLLPKQIEKQILKQKTLHQIISNTSTMYIIIDSHRLANI